MVGRGGWKGSRNGTGGITTILSGGRVGNCAGGWAAKGMDMRLHTDSDTGLVSLGVIGILVVGDGFRLHVLGAWYLQVAVVVHKRVGLQGSVRSLHACMKIGSVVGPHEGVVANI